MLGLAVFLLATSLEAAAESPFPGDASKRGAAESSTPDMTPTTDSSNESGPQAVRSSSSGAATAEDAALELPDAPTFQGSMVGESFGVTSTEQASDTPTAQHSSRPRFAPAPVAPLYNKYIEEGQTAQPLLGARRKVLFGLDQMVSPYYLLSIVAAAGYEQALNGSPNYGSNISAFGQRVGAAAATNASQSVFTDGVMPAVFHQDPRYYVKGRGHSIFARGAYAISRVFVTRSDGGDNAPNYSLFAGHAATAALQNAYYPPINQGASESAKSYANSFAGTALSNGIREFFPDLLHLAHLE